jgi:hypothetical protein
MMSDTAMSDYEVSPDRRAFEVFKREILALWEEDKMRRRQRNVIWRSGCARWNATTPTLC